jgi:succinate dehydrogenase / fumarate reductase iron-sulfur subunit
VINGTERLACITNVWALGTATVTLAPLEGFKCLGDLVVDRAAFFLDIDPSWSHRLTAEGQVGGETFERFENCIECGACVSACPATRPNGRFTGPAALAALHREWLKNPAGRNELIAVAAGEKGVGRCTRALACSRVCPGAVYPSGHIAKLIRKLDPP